MTMPARTQAFSTDQALQRQAEGNHALARGAETQGAALEILAREARSAADIDTRYRDALIVEREAKTDQVERLEQRIEILLDTEGARLEATLAHPPGLFASATTRAAWDSSVLQQQATLQRLHGRLELVQEIKEAMAPDGPALESLAARKARYRDPELAAAWDALRVDERWAAVEERRAAVPTLSVGTERLVAQHRLVPERSWSS